MSREWGEDCDDAGVRMSGSSWRDFEDLRRELGMIAGHLQQQFAPERAPRCWQPAVNVYRCPDCFLVCVEVAGVQAEDVHVLAEPRRLVVRGRRPPPEPDDGSTLQVLAMEIDYGRFERVVVFPMEVDIERVKAERRDGLVWIRLPLSHHA